MHTEIISRKTLELKIKQQANIKSIEWDLYYDHTMSCLLRWVNARLEENMRLNCSNPAFSQDINYAFLNKLTHQSPPHYNKNGMHMIVSGLKRKVDTSHDWTLNAKERITDTVKITISERKHKVSLKKIFKH